MIKTGSGIVSYEAVRTAMNGEPYTMSLTDTDDIRAVIEAVNQGIDSHLEGCFCPERGDRYEGGSRKAGKLNLFVTSGSIEVRKNHPLPPQTAASE